MQDDATGGRPCRGNTMLDKKTLTHLERLLLLVLLELREGAKNLSDLSLLLALNRFRLLPQEE